MTPIWWNLTATHGVLELDWGLELHVLTTPHGALAWWLLDSGAWLGEVTFGLA